MLFKQNENVARMKLIDGAVFTLGLIAACEASRLLGTSFLEKFFISYSILLVVAWYSQMAFKTSDDVKHIRELDEAVHELRSHNIPGPFITIIRNGMIALPHIIFLIPFAALSAYLA